MKILAPIALASLLLVSACASSVPNKAAPQPASVASTSAVHQYRCASGETIVASYPSTDSATVQYKSRKHAMKIAVSGSGARYVGDGLEWWTKGSGRGSEGTLFRHMADGKSGTVMENCKAS